jgi:hypothetical protein
LVAYLLLQCLREAVAPILTIINIRYGHGETTMKKSVTGFHLINCGSVTGGTHGLPIGFFYEGTPPPFNLTIFH